MSLTRQAIEMEKCELTQHPTSTECERMSSNHEEWTESGVSGVLEMCREESRTSTDMGSCSDSCLNDSARPDNSKPKKAKKRVGRIGFAEVMVSEQVIKNTDEDLEMRRDHWRAIQDKADDPNSIFSNESSKANSPVPSASAQGSPHINSMGDSELQVDRIDSLAPLSPKNLAINHHQLNQQLLDILKEANQDSGLDVSEKVYILTDSRGTSELDSKNQFDFAESAVLSEEIEQLCQPKESNGSELSEYVSSSVVNDSSSKLEEAQVIQPQYLSKSSMNEDDGKGERDINAQGPLGTSNWTPRLSDSGIKTKSDEKALKEPPGAGCPRLDFPNLNSYISPKQEHDFFSEMSQALLVYIDLWPKARKAPRNGVLLPRDTKTSKDFAYALQRWLVRTWQAGLKLQNAYHIGILMSQDKDLLHGQNPLIEQNLVSKIENDHELSVQLTAVADINVDDWIAISDRFKNRHLIGENFFPSDEYSALCGLDALTTSQASIQEDGVDDDTGSDAFLWEADASIGLPLTFSAKTDHSVWDAPYPLMLTGQGFVDNEQGRMHYGRQDHSSCHMRTGDPDAHPRANKNHGTPRADAACRKRVSTTSSRTQEIPLGRAISEPLPRSSRHVCGDDEFSTRRPATSEMRADHVRTKSRNPEREKKLEADLDFQRFTKSKTGRTRLSQQKLDLLKFAYRDDVLYRRKVQAAKTVSMLIADVGDSLLKKMGGHLDETSKVSQGGSDVHETKRASNLSHCTADSSQNMNVGYSTKQKEKTSSGKSYLAAIESSFSRKIKAKEQSEPSNLESCESPHTYSDVEVDVDEFLRAPMSKQLMHDNILARSMNLTGISNIDQKPQNSNGNESKICLRQSSSQLSRVGAPSQSSGHHEGHHGPSFRLPDLRSRAFNKVDHQVPNQQMQQTMGKQCEGLLKNMLPAGKPVLERRSAQSALGYLDHHQPLGDLIRSPYAQRVRSSFTAFRVNKQSALKPRTTQAVV